MMSLFSKTSEVQKESRRPPLLTTKLTSSGTIIKQDASACNVPQLDPEVVERVEYVPFEFAKEKVLEVATDLTNIKTKYESHVLRIKDFYDKLCEKQRKHYEDYILEVKQKAVDHVAFVKRKQKESEDRLNAQLDLSHKETEDLRDTLAELNRTSRDTIKDLKSKLSEAEISWKEYAEKYEHGLIRLTATENGRDIVATAETNLLQKKLESCRQEFSEKCNELQLQNRKSHDEANRTLSDLKTEHENDTIIRAQCLASIECVLHNLEIEDREQSRQFIGTLRHRIDEVKEDARAYNSMATRDLQSALTKEHQLEVTDLQDRHRQEMEEMKAALTIHEATSLDQLRIEFADERKKLISIAEAKDKHINELKRHVELASASGAAVSVVHKALGYETISNVHLDITRTRKAQFDAEQLELKRAHEAQQVKEEKFLEQEKIRQAQLADMAAEKEAQASLVAAAASAAISTAVSAAMTTEVLHILDVEKISSTKSAQNVQGETDHGPKTHRNNHTDSQKQNKTNSEEVDHYTDDFDGDGDGDDEAVAIALKNGTHDVKNVPSPKKGDRDRDRADAVTGDRGSPPVTDDQELELEMSHLRLENERLRSVIAHMQEVPVSSVIVVATATADTADTADTAANPSDSENDSLTVAKPVHADKTTTDDRNEDLQENSKLVARGEKGKGETKKEGDGRIESNTEKAATVEGQSDATRPDHADEDGARMADLLTRIRQLEEELKVAHSTVSPVSVVAGTTAAAAATVTDTAAGTPDVADIPAAVSGATTPTPLSEPTKSTDAIAADIVDTSAEAIAFHNEVKDSLMAELTSLTDQIKAAAKALAESKAAVLAHKVIYDDAKGNLQKETAARSRVKDEIKKWMKDFEREHNRLPTKDDKETVRDIFEAYQTANDLVKTLQTQFDAFSSTRTELEDEFRRCKAVLQDLQTRQKEMQGELASTETELQVLVDGTKGTKSLQASQAADAGGGPQAGTETMQSDNTAAAASADATKSPDEGVGKEREVVVVQVLPEDLPSKPEDVQQIEELEEEIIRLSKELETSASELTHMKSENEMLTHQVDALVKEKRTDVVKRFEDELKDLRASESAMQLQMATLKAEKTKADSHVKELAERVDKSEAELRDRDEREQKSLAPTDERFALKGQIGKQRTEIIQKSKAATAGWDAAANADERLEKEVSKAYNAGLQEGQQKNAATFDSLNLAIEQKELRVTEMLLEVAAAEQKVKHSEEEIAAMKLKVEQAQLEVADTIANFAMGGGGSGSGGGDGASSEEVESLRESLDAAQEEIATVSDRCEGLESEMRIMNEKIIIYQQMLSDTLSSGPTTASTAHVPGEEGDEAGGVEKGSGSPASDEVIQDIKQAIIKGTGLWKANKRDECFTLYLKTCEDAATRLRTAIRVPVQDSVAASRGAVGTQGKAKAAVALRKALDSLILELQKPSVKEAEDRAATGGVASGAADAATSSAAAAPAARNDLNPQLLKSLQAQLALLEKQQQIIHKANTNTPAEAVAAGAGAAAADVDENSGSPGRSPLRRQGSQAFSSGKAGQSMKSPSRADASAAAAGAGAGDAAVEVPANNASSSLLKRAKTAEAKVEMLRKQLVAALSGAQVNQEPEIVYVDRPATSTAGGSAVSAGVDDATTTAAAAAAAAVSTSGGTTSATPKAASASVAKAAPSKAASSAAASKADAMEIRKLTRQVKDLELKLADAMNNSGGADKKAAELAEKQMLKKIKDAENAFKKEKTALENRAVKAESALETAVASLPIITAERDQLRTRVKELTGQVQEMEVLRGLAERGAQAESKLADVEREMAVLSDQFKKETALRKKYKNELEDMKGAIRVYARCRPMAKYEIEKACQPVIKIVDDTTVKVATARGEKEFEFDAAFGQQSTQGQVFEDTKRLVESCIDGYNVCLFAYGQTGSGKTFTMTGSPDMPGLTPSAISELFRLIQDRPHCRCKVSTYFVELYNDNLVDLYWILDNGKQKGGHGALEPPRLDIKQDAKKMVFIRNAVLKEANSPDELMDLFTAGNLERHVGATKMNAESSRSHSIFAIMVESYDTTSKKTTMGKLSLVDLAGSERADKTGAGAERLREAQSINKSLSALGDVISALSEGEKFIPYRNNKLTQLMQDSLGGNAKTLMFVNFSPADYNCDETVTSLNYATRVKKITNNASKQAESEEVARLKAIIQRLQGGGAAGGGSAVDALGPVDEEDPSGDEEKAAVGGGGGGDGGTDMDEYS